METLIKLLALVIFSVGGWLIADLQSNSAVKAAAPKEPLRTLQVQAAAAAKNAASETEEPNEIEMIEWRRKLMGKPGLQFYVVFFNDTGQPIDYFVTDGKCSSSGKRLVRPWKFIRGQTGVDNDGYAVHGDLVLPAPAEDGMYGQPDEYIYCKTTDGKYKQWNGRYYVSDAPIELTIKPLVIDMSGRIQHQQ